jgi:hypothetical protein
MNLNYPSADEREGMKSLRDLPGFYVMFDDRGHIHREDQKKQPKHFPPSLQAYIAAVLPRHFTSAQAVKLLPQYSSERVRMTVYNMRKQGYVTTDEKQPKRQRKDLLVHHKTPKGIALEELYRKSQDEQKAAAASGESQDSATN